MQKTTCARLGHPGESGGENSPDGAAVPSQGFTGAEFPVLGRAVQTLRTQVFTFLPALAAQRKPGLIRAKKPVPAAAPPPVRHLERCAWAAGTGCVPPPSLPSPPFSRCPGDNYGIGSVASVADSSGLKEAGFVSPKAREGRGGKPRGPSVGWEISSCSWRAVRNHCLPGG